MFVFPLAFWLAASMPLGGTEVSGHVCSPERAGRSELTIVVFAESLEGRTRVSPGRFKMAQRDKTFVPHILAIPVGSTVDFPNEDPIFHNVFSPSWPDRFDLGIYRAGASKSHVFPKPAIYRVFCMIHPEMTAVILVLPTSFITELDASGNYRLSLPPGRFRLTAWSERTEPVTTEVRVSTSPVRVPNLVVGPSVAEQLSRKKK